ncbi:tRNA pseudouridine(38-40) synthase TruA [Mycoplasmoides pirum]|uniref:tRNA pseudouridine(38-40) synthase TruA n=1 Tax=Mycoplasmoides pirum TaxID=2122 RepID=UPI0006962D82|nr:tRNA pseudouridine(38-40) synthase TruA [Mycoplasmoides pirum]
MSQSPLIPKKGFTRYCFKISYNGSKFHGWAIQPKLKTVQGDLQTALSSLYNEKVIVYGSGRTDSTVHAIAQVFHFDVKKDIPIKGIISKLNSFNFGIWNIFDGKKIIKPFHSRYSVKNKTYLYKIEITKKTNPLTFDFSWQIPYEISLKKLREISKLFIGKKNFLSFTTDKKLDSIRTINKITITKKNNFLYFKINGTGFLRNMVRMIIGCMINFAIDKIDLNHCKNLFDNPSKGKSVFKAPGSGLYLLKVNY